MNDIAGASCSKGFGSERYTQPYGSPSYKSHLQNKYFVLSSQLPHHPTEENSLHFLVWQLTGLIKVQKKLKC